MNVKNVIYSHLSTLEKGLLHESIYCVRVVIYIRHLCLFLSLFSSKCFQCFHIHCGATIYKLKCSQCTAPSTVPLVKAYFFYVNIDYKVLSFTATGHLLNSSLLIQRVHTVLGALFSPPFFLTANRKPQGIALPFESVMMAPFLCQLQSKCLDHSFSLPEGHFAISLDSYKLQTFNRGPCMQVLLHPWLTCNL